MYLSYVYMKYIDGDRNRREREREREREEKEILSFRQTCRSFVYPVVFKRISSRADDGRSLSRFDCGIQF